MKRNVIRHALVSSTIGTPLAGFDHCLYRTLISIRGVKRLCGWLIIASNSQSSQWSNDYKNQGHYCLWNLWNLGSEKNLDCEQSFFPSVVSRFGRTGESEMAQKGTVERQTPVFPWLAAAGFGILGFRIKDSRIPVTIWIRNPGPTDKTSAIHGVASRIQDCLRFPYMEQKIIQLGLPVHSLLIQGFLTFSKFEFVSNVYIIPKKYSIKS